MMTCEQVETCSLYNLNKYLLCWHIPEPSILIAPWTYFTGGLMMTCEQVETCSLYNLNKCLLCWHIPDPSILTASWTYLTGGLMMTYEQVETCSLYTSNKCLLCWRIPGTLLYKSWISFTIWGGPITCLASLGADIQRNVETFIWKRVYFCQSFQSLNVFFRPTKPLTSCVYSNTATCFGYRNKMST